MQNTAQPRLVDKYEIAKLVGVSASTITQWASDGRIPVFRLGYRTVRFDPIEVIDALRAEQL